MQSTNALTGVAVHNV